MILDLKIKAFNYVSKTKPTGQLNDFKSPLIKNEQFKIVI